MRVRRKYESCLRAVAMAILVLLAGCVSTLTTGDSAEEGLASWYGEPYHGRPTASGPIYDQHALTAAHRTLPFGTRIAVTRLDTGRRVEVVVNDRGPFVAGRIVDVSRAAAERLQLIGPGVARVRIEVLARGDGMRGSRCWEVQVGAFGEPDNIARARERLQAAGHSVRLLPASEGLTRVRVAVAGDRQEADRIARSLTRDYPGAAAVPCLPAGEPQ